MKLQATIKYKLYSILGLLLPFLGLSQKAEDNIWHKGYLVLDTQDTINGLIKYDFLNNYVQYQKDEDYRILLPGKFSKVYYRSAIDSSEHTLSIYNIETSKDYYRPYFFEVLDTNGKFKFAQQYYWIQRTSTFGTFGGFSLINEKIMNLYFLKGSEAIFLKPRKKFILNLMVDKKQEVKEKASSCGWNFNNYYDLIKIFKYYNSLFE